MKNVELLKKKSNLRKMNKKKTDAVNLNNNVKKNSQQNVK